MYIVLHYSCESFYDIKDGRTPRVTSIAARHLTTGQTASFSIHKSAEQLRVPPADISQRYDELEKLMLDEYFDFIKSRHNAVDILGAHSAGLITAWVHRDPTAVFDPWGIEPTLSVTDLCELTETIPREPTNR